MQVLNAFSWGVVMIKNARKLALCVLGMTYYDSEASNKTFFDTESWIIDIRK